MRKLTYIGVCVGVAIFTAGSVAAQANIPLYDSEIPNSRPVPDLGYSNADHTAVYKVSHPTLTVFLPPNEKANGTAVIICPGGSYSKLAIAREGYDVARRFIKLGIAAFVLKYRLPDNRTMIDKSIGPLQDAQQAVKRLRENAGKWHIDPGKIGIMGFSAGGHLAATSGTHFDRALIPNSRKTSLRPDFMILVYPVISMMDGLCHKGSRERLLGRNPSAAVIRAFSNELQVTAETPITFIVQAEDDSTVPVENSLRFYEALHRNNIPAALHLYEKGGHGFLKYPSRDKWMRELVYWMETNGLLAQTTVNR